jgi:hypothetical protein
MRQDVGLDAGSDPAFDVSKGSILSFWPRADYFRSFPMSGYFQMRSANLKVPQADKFRTILGVSKGAIAVRCRQALAARHRHVGRAQRWTTK